MLDINTEDEKILAAFVDGELDAAHAAEVLAAMEKDDAIRNRVYRLRRAKDLMRLGFGNALPPAGRRRTTRLPIWKRYALGLAASLTAVAIGIGAGFVGYGMGESSQRANLAATTTVQTDRILLHINEADPRQFTAALEYAERFIEEHEARGGEIAVVAHSTGIDLMRVGVSPYEGKVRDMIARHKNVYFIACANAIGELRQKGIEPVMMDNVDTSKPAMDQIIEHVQDGWKYIKVKKLLAQT
jgi:intracellular sulfur oxidation DsrE/DsrF family protein